MMTLHEFLEAVRAGEVQLYLSRSPLDPEDIGSVILLARDKETWPFFESVFTHFDTIITSLVALNSIHVCLNPAMHQRQWYQHQIGALGCVPVCAECSAIREAIAPEVWKMLREREHRQED
jgi:hypothetical protein